MQALVCNALSGPEALSWCTTSDPVLDSSGLRIAVHAASINFPDALVIRGQYQIKLPPPFIPGMEVSGQVIQIGDQVQGFTIGDRVSAVLTDFGGFAEQICVSADSAFRLPDALPYDVAACIPSVYGTAYYSLVSRAAVSAGETVLIMGAAGGVGIASIRIAKKLGATVIAVVSTEEKATIATKCGADHIINFMQEDLKARVKNLTAGNGADIIVDPVGGEQTSIVQRALAWGGRHLMIGFAAGAIPRIATNLLLLKNASMIGVNFGAYSTNFTQEAKAINHILNAWLAEDRQLWPVISTRQPMQEGAAAMTNFEKRSSTGKSILVLGPD